MLSALLLTSSLFGAGAASAFSDVKDKDQLNVVQSLQSKGIIKGVTSDRFVPNKTITNAQAIQLVVKATKLDEQPNLTGKSFKTVPENAWYADAVNIAVMHGLPVSEDTKWNEAITREDFANLLSSAIQKTGNYPVIMMYIHVADEEQMKEDSRGAVQFLLLTKIAELDKDNKFNPKKPLTRMEAAQMTHAAIRFIEQHNQEAVDEEEQTGDGVSVETVKVNDEVNKIVITKDNLPHPGYSIGIHSIEFTSDKEAVVYYKVNQPDPDKMYPQVISESSAETFVPAQYSVKVKHAQGLK